MITGAAGADPAPDWTVYLPGSWPGKGHEVGPDAASGSDIEDLVRAQLSSAAQYLGAVGDGEPGRGYVTYISDSLRRDPAIRVARDGQWRDFGDRTVLGRRRPWSPLPALDDHLGYARFAHRSLPALRRVREEFGRDDAALLAGIPSPLTTASVTFGVAGAVFYRRSFRAATAREVIRVAALGPDVILQLEAPAETIATAGAPRRLLRPAASLLARDLCRTAAAAPAGATMTVHLCLGSLNNQPALRLRDSQPLVELANAIARQWPAGRRLAAVHMPLTTVADPAPLGSGFYAPLAGLRLPPGAFLAAGLVHAPQALSDQLQALRLARAAVPTRIPMAVGPPCGLGRDTPEGAARAVKRSVELAHELAAAASSASPPAPARRSEAAANPLPGRSEAGAPSRS